MTEQQPIMIDDMDAELITLSHCELTRDETKALSGIGWLNDKV